jgi:hypothetical protein
MISGTESIHGCRCNRVVDLRTATSIRELPLGSQRSKLKGTPFALPLAMLVRSSETTLLIHTPTDVSYPVDLTRSGPYRVTDPARPLMWASDGPATRWPMLPSSQLPGELWLRSLEVR